MKLAAIISLWDGEELLEGALGQIRSDVDVVICVSQVYSNYGERYEEGFNKALQMFRDKMVDDFIHYKPNLQTSAMQNETIKRNMGLERARELDCTHFLFLDTDEYYDTEQFRTAKEAVVKWDYAGSACRLHTYFRKPSMRLAPMEGYYVPFIHKLAPSTRAGMCDYPVYADPTRQIKGVKSFKVFEPEQLTMHHYSWVRNDIRRKLENSSARQNFEDRIDEFVATFSSLQIGDAPPFFSSHRLVAAEDKFNVAQWLESHS